MSLPGTYKAILSAATGPNARNAIQLFPDDGSAVFNAQGAKIVDHLSQLWSCLCLNCTCFVNPIQLPPNSPQFNVDVWTGTNPEGEASGVDCEGWESSLTTQSGDWGVSFSENSGWIQRTVPDLCPNLKHVYCLRVVPALSPSPLLI